MHKRVSNEISAFNLRLSIHWILFLFPQLIHSGQFIKLLPSLHHSRKPFQKD